MCMCVCVIGHFQAYMAPLLLTNPCVCERECGSVWWDLERMPIFEVKKKSFLCLIKTLAH